MIFEIEISVRIILFSFTQAWNSLTLVTFIFLVVSLRSNFNCCISYLFFELLVELCHAFHRKGFLAKRAISYDFTPSQDASTVEVVTNVARKSSNFLPAFESFHTDDTLNPSSFEQAGIEIALIQSQNLQGCPISSLSPNNESLTFRNPPKHLKLTTLLLSLVIIWPEAIAYLVYEPRASL